MPLADVFSLLVLGQGKSGLDVARWALAHPERVSTVTVYGGGTSEPNDATRALEAAGASFVYGTEQVEGAYDVCVTCPGISEFSGFFKAGREHAAQIMGEPEFAYRLSPDNWIAITGTNGKTTTTSLTDYLLKAAGEASVAVGNIGEPPVNEIDGRAHNEWFVAELSSYQIATTTELHPRVAVLLNITPDHLGWHKSHKNYALAKIKLFDNMVDDDLVVVDVEDAGIHEFDEYIYTPGRRICKVAFDEPEGAGRRLCARWQDGRAPEGRRDSACRHVRAQDLGPSQCYQCPVRCHGCPGSRCRCRWCLPRSGLVPAARAPRGAVWRD
ncbi:MAG: Mur ligase family protein [Collinsella sp.]